MSQESQQTSEMADALALCDSKKIEELGRSGAKLLPGENAVVLIANGYNPDDLDGIYSQSHERIKSVVAAAVQAGVDVNAPVEGEPACHYLTRRYVWPYTAALYDQSYEATIGMTDQDQMKRLAAFAGNGVDFSKLNAKGEDCATVGMQVVETYAKQREPHTMAADYDALHEGDTPRYNKVKASVAMDLMRIPGAVQHEGFDAQTVDPGPPPSPSEKYNLTTQFDKHSPFGLAALVDSREHPLVALASARDPNTRMYAGDSDIRTALKSLRDAGVPLADRVGDTPIGHHLAEIQATKFAEQKLVGLHRTPGDQPLAQLVVYAENGVDFSARGPAGTSAKTAAVDAYTAFAETRKPGSTKEDCPPGTDAIEHRKVLLHHEKNTTQIHGTFREIRQVSARRLAHQALSGAKPPSPKTVKHDGDER